MVGVLFAELDLDCIEEFPIEDGRLLPGQHLSFECDLANVKPISEQVCQTATTYRPLKGQERQMGREAADVTGQLLDGGKLGRIRRDG